MHAIRNVNLLDPEAALSFAPSGLTLIYGDNGSGKSGYVRILKKTGRARDGGQPIHPSVFEHASGQPASAIITFTEEGCESVPYEWQDTPEHHPSPALSRLSIFDSSCAAIYVSEDHQVAYRPLGLDLLDQLAQAADNVSHRIDELIASRVACLTEPPETVQQAPLLKALLPLNASTTAEAIEAAGKMSAHEAQELDVLRRTVGEETPGQRAATIRARKAVLEGLVDRMQSVCGLLGPNPLLDIATHLGALIEASRADELAAHEAFADLLPGTGSGPWKLLWEHARAFSQTCAYPGNAFPNTADDAKCVLCQQPLTAAARSRFVDFEKYVRASTAAAVQQHRATVAKDRAAIEALTPDDDATQAAGQELLAHDAELANRVRAFLTDATEKRRQLLLAIDSLSLPSVTGSSFGTDPIAQIISELEKEASALAASEDPEKLRSAQARLVELEARWWIHENRASMLSELERIRLLQRLSIAKQSTKTAPISLKAGELTNKYVTSDLEEKIEKELQRVGPRQLHLGVHRKTVKGITSHRLVMKDAKIADIPLDEISSEGEFCGIALAAFLAELAQSGSLAPIVVDDPVCSLDHLHREAVADRLVEEATERQVIVFTHDLVFLSDLFDACKTRGTVPTVRQVVRRNARTTGGVIDDLPWEGKCASERVKQLGEQLRKLEEVYESDEQTYQERGAFWCGKLRETWERVVEELVLNSVVVRFSRAVETNRLERVTDDLSRADFQRVSAGMGKTSKWLPGHDQPAAVKAPVPPPRELEAALGDIGTYIKELKSRSRNPRKSLTG